MAEISLIDYIYEIEAMLDEGLADDALSHTWHILKHYPKYIKAYRLLGKALKVQSRYREAIAVFQRLLSVLPDDVEVHRLLSVIYHEENLVQTAIYHAERAFEIQPADEDLREHLASLLQLRDGKKPQIRLTQAALVRLYLKDNQLEQASDELERLLKDEPTRVDLLLLMAQIAYQKKEFDEAYSLCISLLEKLPFALEALYILAELLTQQGKFDEAQVYWQRMRELDPYDKRIPKTPEELLKGDSPLTWLEPLEPFPSSQDTGWLEALAIPVSDVLFEQNASMLAGLEEELEEAADKEEEELIEEIEKSEPSQYSKEMEEDILAISDLWTEESPEGDKVDSFIADSSSAQQIEEAKKQEVVLPDWIYELAQVDVEKVKAMEEGPEQEEADWIKALESVLSSSNDQSNEDEMREDYKKTKDSLGGEEGLKPSEALMADRAELGNESPEWLKELEKQVSVAETAESERPPEELPDWLKELEEQPSAAEKAEGERPSEELPEWLKELEEQPSAVEEAKGKRPPEELPEWLKELEEQPPVAEKGEGERPPEELPEWLKELEEQPSMEEKAKDERPLEELPEWLKELEEQPAAVEMAESKRPPEELPEWLKELEKQPSMVETAEGERPPEELPEWLKELEEQPPVAETIEAERPPEELPEWLKELEEQPSMVETAEGERPPEELPEWLKELEEQPSMAETAEGERPSEELPEWLKELEEQPSVAETAEGERPSEELPEWLKELEEQPIMAETAEGERPSEELPEWLKELEEQPSMAETAEGERPPEELPEWLKELEEQPSLAETAEGERPPEELPTWLKELEEEVAKAEAVEHSAAVEVISDVIEEEQPSKHEVELGVEAVAEEVPDWLMGAAIEEEAEAGILIQDELAAKSPEEQQIVDWTEEYVFEVEEAQSVPVLESDEGLPQWLDNIIESTASETVENQPVEEAIPRESVLPQWQMVDESSLREGEEESELPQLQLSEPELPVSTFESVDAAISWLESVTQQDEKEEGVFPGQEYGEPLPTKPAKWVLEKEVKEGEAQKDVHVSERTMEKATVLSGTPLVINLNKASLKDLEKLPGVNFRLALNIMNYRQTHGKIRSIEELNRIPKLDTSQWKNIPIKVVLEDEETKQPTETACLDETQVVIERAMDLMSEGYFEQAIAPLAELIRKRIQLDKIITMLNKAIDHHPKEILLWQTLGDAYVRADRLKEAIRAYQRAEELLEG